MTKGKSSDEIFAMLDELNAESSVARLSRLGVNLHEAFAIKANEAELNKYVPNWSKISNQRRQKAKWCCEACKVDLNQAPWAQPNHGHMKVDVKTKATILSARGGI